MAEAEYPDDPYDDSPPPPTAGGDPEPEPSGYTGGITIVGWTAQGSSWVPIYRGSDGNYYTADRSPWSGDPGSLQKGSGEGGRPTWEPGQQPPAAPAPSQPPPVYDSGGGGGGGGGGDFKVTLPSVPSTFYPAPPPFTYGEFVPPEFNAPEFQAPGAFEYAPFEAPSGQAVLDEDPGYGFRMQQGAQARKNQASSQGLLRSGGFAKGLEDYSQGLASQEYGNAFGRKFGTWEANRAAAGQDYDRDWRNKLTTYGMDYDKEIDEYNRSVSSYGVNFGGAATKYGFDLDRAAGIAGGKQGATALAGQFGLGLAGLQMQKDREGWDRLLSLYDISSRSLPSYNPSSISAMGY